MSSSDYQKGKVFTLESGSFVLPSQQWTVI